MSMRSIVVGVVVVFAGAFSWLHGHALWHAFMAMHGAR